MPQEGAGHLTIESEAGLTPSAAMDLSASYSAEVDQVDKATWYELLDQFDDANIYQTWAYEEVRSGRQNISHLVLKQGGRVVAIAQARVAKLPLLKAGIAYVRWGPVWRLRNQTRNPEIFRQAIRALNQEYARKRGLVLRIYPALFQEDTTLAAILAEEGFSRTAAKTPDRTLLVDMNRSLEELREGMRPHWRRELKVALKRAPEVVEGTDDQSFATFIEIYKEMVTRKKFAEPNDIYEFQRIQSRLPERLKMKVMLCRSGEAVSSGLVCSAMGNTALYLFGATSDAGKQSRGSYLLQWKLLEWLKESRCSIYDLNGINPVANPGTFKFKDDLCGTNGRDVHFLGRFETCSNALSSTSVALGETLRRVLGRS